MSYTLAPPAPAREELAVRYSALGSEARLAILEALAGAEPGGLSLGEIGEQSGISGSTLTHHMRILVHAGFASQTRCGKRILCEGAKRDWMRALADHLMTLPVGARRPHGN